MTLPVSGPSERAKKAAWAAISNMAGHGYDVFGDSWITNVLNVAYAIDFPARQDSGNQVVTRPVPLDDAASAVPADLERLIEEFDKAVRAEDRNIETSRNLVEHEAVEAAYLAAKARLLAAWKAVLDDNPKVEP